MKFKLFQIAFCMLVGIAPAHATSLKLGNVSAVLNQVVTVPLVYDSKNASVVGLQSEINYDSSKVQLVDVIPGGIVNSHDFRWSQFRHDLNPAREFLRIVAAPKDDLKKLASGTLALLQLRVIDDHQPIIKLHQPQSIGSQQDATNYDVLHQDGSIEIFPLLFYENDTDGDGIPDAIELAAGLDISSIDSDGNGILDGDEDLDGDGLSNADEVGFGSKIENADSDADGINDDVEVGRISQDHFHGWSVQFDSANIIESLDNWRNGAITTDSDGNVYIIAENSVEKYDAFGEHVQSFAGQYQAIASYGPYLYMLGWSHLRIMEGSAHYADYPHTGNALAVDVDGNIYMGTDGINGDIFVKAITPSNQSLGQWAWTGYGQDKLDGIYINGKRVYVAIRDFVQITSTNTKQTPILIEIDNAGFDGVYGTIDDGLNGQARWQQPIVSNNGNGHIYGVGFDSAGNIYAGGSVDGCMHSSLSPVEHDVDPLNVPCSGHAVDAFFLKLSPNREPQWVKTIGTSCGVEEVTGLVVDSNDNVMVSGRWGGNSSIFCVQEDFDANPNASDNITPYNPVPTSYDPFYVPSIDTFIIRLDENGQHQWATKLGGIGNDLPSALAIDNEDNLYISMNFDQEAEFDFLLGRDIKDPVNGDGVLIKMLAKTADLDGDGVANAIDAFPYDASESADTDGDGFGDNVDPDIDEDGMPNDWESLYGLDPFNATDGLSSSDFDGDGLSNIAEYLIGLNPAVADTDGDGMNDGDEVAVGSDPNRDDTDTDGDGLADLDDPDDDGDGMPDDWEIANGLDPLLSSDALLDPDNDGLNNQQEHAAGTLINVKDTDGDLVEDGEEVALGSDPLYKDIGPCNKHNPYDLNGDGLSDVITVDDANQLIPDINYYARESGSIRKTPVVSPDSVASSTQSLHFGDFTGDGCSDVVQFINIEGGQATDLLLWKNLHNGKLASEYTTVQDIVPSDAIVFVADFNDDKYQDISYLQYSGNGKMDFVVILNEGQGLFTNAPIVHPDLLDAQGQWYIAEFNVGSSVDVAQLVDSDKNGLADLKVFYGEYGNYDSTRYTVYPNIANTDYDLFFENMLEGSIVELVQITSSEILVTPFLSPSTFGTPIVMFNHVAVHESMGLYDWNVYLQPDKNSRYADVILVDKVCCNIYPDVAVFSNTGFKIDTPPHILYDISSKLILHGLYNTDNDGDGIANILDDDRDNDGMLDEWEIQYGFNPYFAKDAAEDTDGDGLKNLLEFDYGSNPLVEDTDGDGMDDFYEYRYLFDILTNDANSDVDEDGLSNLLEYENSSNPRVIDTDGDGLSDGEEYHDHGTELLLVDSDGDGVSDGDEVNAGTDPLTPPNLSPTINSVTANPSSILDTAIAPVAVQATDSDGPNALTYQWTVPPGQGGVDTPTSATAIYTPPDITGTLDVTLTVSVFDGVTTVSDTVTITVTDAGSMPVLLDEDFNSSDLSGWTVADEGTEGGASDWRISGGQLLQTTNNHIPTGTPPEIPLLGTYIVYDSGYGWSDYKVSYTMRSGDNDFIGLMFRVQDNDNYYRYSWSNQYGVAHLTKKVNGQFSLIGEYASAYNIGQTYAVDVVVQGSTITVSVDGIPMFIESDPGLANGSIAFYTYANDDSTFDDLVVEDLGGGPVNILPTITSVTANPSSILDTDITPVAVQASDSDGPNSLTYSWTVPPGQGNVDTPNSNTAIYTPPDISGTLDVTLTVFVSDGATTVSDTVTITVTDASSTPVLLGEDFASGNLSGWTVVDEGTDGGASDWRVSGGQLLQTTNNHVPFNPGGPVDIPLLGTYLVYDSGYGWSDYRVRYTMRSGDDDFIGLMFRVQDNDNYYRFNWSSQYGVAHLTKKVNGQFSLIQEYSSAYNIGQTYAVEITVQGSAVMVSVDGVPVFTESDPDLTSGSIAFYTYANNDSTFDDLMVEDLGGGPVNILPTITSVTANPASILDTDITSLSVQASDSDGPNALTYQWTVPPGQGSVDTTFSMIPIYTPPDITGTLDVTLTVSVSDGATTVSDTVTITVTDANSTSVLLDDNFNSGDLSNWTVVDEGTEGGASDWRISGGQLVQTTNNHVPAGTPPEIPLWGTYLVYNNGYGWSDYKVRFTMRSGDNDFVGLMFRVQDNDNYYRYSWSNQYGVARLTKKVAGQYVQLQENVSSYAIGQTYAVEVAVQGSSITVSVDGVPVFIESDPDLASGSIAFYTYANDDSTFDDLMVEDLGGGLVNIPPIITSVTANPSSILDTAITPLAVLASDSDGPNTLTYHWTVPLGLGSVDTPNSPTAIYTPPDITGTQDVTLTVSVSDGAAIVNDSVTVTVSDADSTPVLLEKDFNSGDLNGWTVVDEGTDGGASDWRISGGQLLQTTNNHVPFPPSGPVDIPLLGTYLLYDNGYGWSDYRVRYTMRSGDNDFIGLMFRVQDNDNYYRFNWSNQYGVAHLTKKVNGQFYLIQETSSAYNLGQTYAVDVMVQGSAITVLVDGLPLFNQSDLDLEMGSIAFYTYANDDSAFDDLVVEPLN